MNKSKIYLCVMVLAIIATFNSCKKDSESNPFGTLTAKINGTDWKSNARVSVLTNGILTITAYTGVVTGSGEVMIITVNGDQTGNYQLNVLAGLVQCGAIYKKSTNATGPDMYESTTAKVIITEFDKVNKRLSGTFEYKAGISDIKTVTEGSFNKLIFSEVK